MERKVAFVTGASRGIGRATALALAEKGFDIVVTARTVKEGETADGRALPGSIESTAAEVEKRGARALPLRLDLLDATSIKSAVEETFTQWGHIDVLVNNGIYVGPANMELVMELDLAEARRLFEANVFAQLDLIQRILPRMLERKSGLIVNLVSGSAFHDPPAPANQGGWGYAYAASKAAFVRLAGVLSVEHKGSGVRFMSLEPGFVMTEAMKLNDPDGALEKYAVPAPMEVPASVIAWLATEPAAAKYDGEVVFAQPLCLELGLRPDWRESETEA